MSTSVKSHSSTQVTGGTSRCARVMCSAMSRRTPRSGSRRPSSALVPEPAAPRTSSSVIRPPGPLPETEPRSTPSSAATRRTRGVARTFAAAGRGAATSLRGASSARGCSTRSGAAPSPPITTSTVPTGTTSPSATRIRETVPAAGEGISTVVLSVWISTSGSSSATSCPSDTSHRAISPSVSPSPRSGSLNSYAISADSRRREARRRARRHERRGRGSRSASRAGRRPGSPARAPLRARTSARAP